MPPAWNWFPMLTLDGGAGIGPVFFHLLPYIEQDTLYRSSRHQSASPPQDYFDYGLTITGRQIALYNCPLDPAGARRRAGDRPVRGEQLRRQFPRLWSGR